LFLYIILFIYFIVCVLFGMWVNVSGVIMVWKLESVIHGRGLAGISLASVIYGRGLAGDFTLAQQL